MGDFINYKIGGGECLRQKKLYRLLKMSLMKFWGKTMWRKYDKRAKSKRGYQIDEMT